MPAEDQRFPVPHGPSTDQGHELEGASRESSQPRRHGNGAGRVSVSARPLLTGRSLSLNAQEVSLAYLTMTAKATRRMRMSAFQSQHRERCSHRVAWLLWSAHDAPSKSY
jgi:hypothetical protein